MKKTLLEKIETMVGTKKGTETETGTEIETGIEEGIAGGHGERGEGATPSRLAGTEAGKIRETNQESVEDSDIGNVPNKIVGLA
mmetsp:Transcript_18167/g.28964  ORF Transcript_18167/g.28964 Transcript_18167/m.28964 type:complete len:84 (+) Transcript_18167:508-759(+)